MYSQRMREVLDRTGHLMRFMTSSTWALRQGDAGICDFVAGNPQEFPLPGYVDALTRAAAPQNKDWFAYKLSEPEAQKIVAKTLRERIGLDFDPEDVFMTDGAFAGLSVSLLSLIDKGDEAVFITPPWFFYEAMIAFAGGDPVRVKVDPATFDLDVEAIAASLTDRTRAVIVNSPNNPTGKIYPPSTLERLASVLDERSQRNGRPVYLISDEAYCRILYDGNAHHSPALYYPNTLVIYTYGKTLLTPGMRLGYIALPPEMPDGMRMRAVLVMAQIASGWSFPVALLQHALADIEGLSIDIAHLQTKRDLMVAELRRIGYELHSPEGTFYLLPKSPVEDDLAFTEILAAEDVFVLPGTVVEMPGYFRVSVTASDEMIERSITGFEAAFRKASKG